MGFANLEAAVLCELQAFTLRRLGPEFLLVQLPDAARIHASDAAKFIQWNLPIHHMWPCKPHETTGFIEKAARALAAKFASTQPQTVFVGTLETAAHNRMFRSLASNLRGRTLQLFPSGLGEVRSADQQDAARPTLFAMVGEQGLFAGVSTPRDANGFHPGGVRFFKQSDPGSISRAGAKIAGALHHLLLHQASPAPGTRWLELGASPGGMTSELLARGYSVTAVDRAPLDRRLLAEHEGPNGGRLRTVLADAAEWRPEPGSRFGAILCDMNGDARSAMRIVLPHSQNLAPGGIVIFTVKMPDAQTFEAIGELVRDVEQSAREGGLVRIFLTHLPYNRHEFTMAFRRAPTPPRRCPP